MQHSRQKKVECAYCRIPMERASGYSENSGMGMAVCPPVAFSELVSGISIAPLQRTRFTVRTDPKESRGELLGSFKAIKMIEEWYGPTLLWVSALVGRVRFIVVLINRELTFWPVGSLREDQTHITFMRGWDGAIMYS